jgi:DNA-nicking Smr family endonuclease
MTSKDENDDGDFASLMAGNADVKSKQYQQRASDIAKLAHKLELDSSKSAIRKAALGESQSHTDTLKTLAAEKHAPQDPIEFKQAGLQNGVYKKLRTGRYDVEAKLDLHGLTVAQALSATLQFVNTSMSAHKRCVLISHGKGIKQEQPARLKNYLAAWLKNMPEVMAYYSALPSQGGTGAVLVLLRKSEQHKTENRERFANVKKGKA